MVSLLNLSNIIKNKDCFYILTHMYPDGDALGSSFALCRAIQKCGKHAKVLCNDPVPLKFRYLESYIKKEEFDPQYIISVDLADTTLLGPNLEKYKSQKINVCIDHHLSNKNYASLSFVDITAASTCEIIYKLLLEMNIKIDEKIASCLYTGIATDTGCFEYSNTTATTHFIAAKLINHGAKIDEINEKLFTIKTKKNIETEKIINKNLKFFFNDKCAITYITLKEMDEIGIKENELDGIASIPIKIEGVKIGVTIREKSSGLNKISVRTSSDVDANEFCNLFGGGGHTKAAGFSMEGSIEHITKSILEKIKSELNW